MKRIFRSRFFASQSANLKPVLSLAEGSKIENLKWLGLSVIAFVLVVGEVVAQAQQTMKIPRIGFLYASSPSSDVRTRFLQGLRKFGCQLRHQNRKYWSAEQGSGVKLRCESLALLMSALGHKRTYAVQQAMSALHPIATAKADMPQW